MRAAVIIPSSGRNGTLTGTLEALCLQNCGDFEVVVVDDASPTGIADRVQPFEARLAIRTLRLPNPAGAGAARNAGAGMAEAELLVFLDDDCIASPNWLSSYVRAADDPQHLLAGPIRNGSPGNIYANAYHSVLESLFSSHLEDRSATRMPFVCAANFGVNRQRFLALGGFDPAFRHGGEDRGFSVKWLAGGGLLQAVPDASVLHRHDLDFRRFVLQQFAYGRSATRVRSWKAAQGFPPAGLESPGLYARILRDSLATGSPGRLALVLLSQVAVAAGAGWEAVGAGRGREL